ncbi:penicillin-binding protein 1B [Thiorhodococcus mannitoliphagus]|uniref:Penicillin-binding protein 1B n=1 Tax=Thiorhodococcus mannitoliphagus TaxID=329406 RepID=A0A6P1DP77_9GAMM|nr:penicillin-binding protein 1B [Thiorhodococcus mannitoliphagus]
MPSSNRRPSSQRRRRVPKPKRFRLGRFIFRSTLVLTLVVGGLIALYGAHLDRVVRDKFEGQRWALPARVYARPLELYVGKPLKADDLQAELDRLSYHETASPSVPGYFHREGDSIRFRTRAFRFWDGREPDRFLEVSFEDGKVAGIKELEEGRPDPALVRLDPMLIASIYPTHNEDRVLVRRKEIPDLLVRTLMAVEDRNFYHHMGVDPKGILRAAVSNLQAGAVVEGASTLTQQLVKNFYLSADRTFERKIKEAYMALLLERRYSKDEILEAYANEIYLGQDGSRAIHGFGLASEFYFDLPLSELDVAKTALLVGLVQAPSGLDPRRHPEAAERRRNLVLDLMVRDGVIEPEAAEQAKAQPLGIQDGGGRPAGAYPHFITLVRRQLQRDYRDDDLRSEGLNIFTTLDPQVQNTVEAALPKRLAALEKQRGMKPGTLETAAVVTSVTQGEVLAVAGGRESGYAGFNRALDAVRSIGSLVKPAVYLRALSEPDRYTLTTSIQDKPVSLPDGNRRWEPKNYNHRVYGAVPLYSALVRSLNLATVNLGLSVGVSEVADTLYAMGVQRRIRKVPSLLLGSVSMSPLEVAQMYQTIAAGGYRAPLRAIREVVDPHGLPLNRYPLAVEAVVDPKAAYLTTWAMERVVTQGTAKWLGAKLPEGMSMAGKTGTTDDMRDSWFAGFSGDKVAVVWVGRDDYKPMGLAGGTGALRVWGDFMLAMENEPLPGDPPDGVVLADACGNSKVPYIGDSASRPGCGGGGGTKKRAKPSGKSESRVAQTGPDASESAEQRPPPPPAPKPREKPENHFMRDFYN